ncbi:MAG TPA: hypothetical protein VMA35_11820 [Candidatus Sulfopaludibacter sp.]|nr:hypothetical protein [Candidatus Sulfopaludibacter sp.]
MKTKTAVLSSMFCAGLLLGTTWPVCADTLIAFQCDMTYQVQNSQFTNGVNTLKVYTYNATPAAVTNLVLTNNPASLVNTNLYTGTWDDMVDTNGAQIQYKFYAVGSSIPGGPYETTATYNDNRVTLLPAGSGQQSLVLPVQFFSDQGINLASPQFVVTSNIWFQVDMSQQIALGTFNPSTQTVEVDGSLGSGNNFGFGQGTTPSGNTLTNDPTLLRTNQFGLVTSNVYTGFLSQLIAGSPGQNAQFKYRIQPSAIYESPNNLNGDAQNSHNRFFFLTATTTNPIVFFSDQPYAPIGTNRITFSVDMSAQIWSGQMSNQQVRLSGDFNNWDTSGTLGNLCTNNPNASNTNIYSATATITNGVGAATQFKFGYVNGNYENNPTHTYPGDPSVAIITPNREFIMPDVSGTNLTLPTVYFNDTSTYSVLPAPPPTNFVTFSVSMTNAVGTDSHVFNPNTDSVYLNGVDVTMTLGTYRFDPWTNNPTGNPLGNFLMINNPVGSEIYTITVPIPAGYPVMLSYQYSINGNQDEANGINHTRYIRSTGNYVLPLDVFGNMVQEQSFGNLAVGAKSGGNVPITWLGRPGVHLQVKTNLTVGAWTDLLGTDAQSATNYPAGAGASYFRLTNPF